MKDGHTPHPSLEPWNPQPLEPFFIFMSELLTVIGLILVLEGLPYFASPHRFKQWIGKVLEMTESQLRVYGLISMLIGLLLVYLARRSGWFG